MIRKYELRALITRLEATPPMKVGFAITGFFEESTEVKAWLHWANSNRTAAYRIAKVTTFLILLRQFEVNYETYLESHRHLTAMWEQVTGRDDWGLESNQDPQSVAEELRKHYGIP